MKRNIIKWGRGSSFLFYAFLFAILVLPRVPWAQISCGDLPPAPPKRIAGGESFPPLPLPATPLRRTERKRPPAPPTLMAKVNYEFSRVNYQGHAVYDWVTPSGDMKNLFSQLRSDLDVNYKADVLQLDKFDYAPERMPIMYFTSHKGIQLDPATRSRIRQYVLDGGAILAASGGGSDEFTKTFREEIQKIFPDRPWYVLPADHPVFRCNYDLGKVQMKKDAGAPYADNPHLEGLNIGCRTAIIFCPADLSCGWDNHTHDEGLRVMPPDAKKIGVNVMAYLLAYYRLGRTASTPVVFNQVGESTQDVQVAQIVHNGDWDPSPSSLQFMLKSVSEETSAFVNYRCVPVDLDKVDLLDFPVAFLTGHLNFELSDKGIENLRNYLNRGGTLLVSNCCNRHDFDVAVHRELAKVFPDTPLKALDASSPVYSTQFDLTAKAGGKLRLEGITRNNSTCVIYSPNSIATVWDREPRPYEDLPDPTDARKEGVNMLVYAMTN